MVHFIPPSQRRLVLLAAQSDNAPALIFGAPGTGKGGIARWIHSNGPRAAKPFIQAHHDAPLLSQVPAAQGGTLVVPDIGEWPLGEQMALVNFLKSKSVPHPENKDLRLLANVRIIATTSLPLDMRAQGGLFNSELLEKLNVYRIEMPSLSKRAEEFEDIALGIVLEITREIHKEHLRELSPQAWERLKSYEWPGNLRELRNVLRIAVIAAKGDRIEVENLPDFGPDRIDFHATREQFEKIYLQEILKTSNWEIDRTCSLTRMDRATLLGKIEKYGITADVI